MAAARPEWTRITVTRGSGAGREVYWAELIGHRDGHFVKCAGGRERAKLKVVTATQGAVSLGEAEELWGRLIREKIGEGYSLGRVSVGPPGRLPSASKGGSSAGVATQVQEVGGTFLIREGRGKPFDFGVREARVQIARQGDRGPWLVGLAIRSYPHPTSHEEAILHLREFPVHGEDVRASRVVIEPPMEMQGAAVLGHWVTNLYRGEHTPTEKNRITITPAGRRRYRVTWSGRGESMSDRFELDCVAAAARRIRYP